MRDRPEDVGLTPLRRARRTPARTATARLMSPVAALRCALRSRAFWVLGGHLLHLRREHERADRHAPDRRVSRLGIPQVRSAQLLAVMGIFDIVGTTASGWLTDRYSSRLAAVRATTRCAASRCCICPSRSQHGADGLGWFAVFYGLDWVATVPPTVRLTSEAFGRENTGVIYGWIGASHQLGASLAAFGAGAIRTSLGDYSVGVLDRWRALRARRHVVPDDRSRRARSARRRSPRHAGDGARLRYTQSQLAAGIKQPRPAMQATDTTSHRHHRLPHATDTTDTTEITSHRHHRDHRPESWADGSQLQASLGMSKLT